MSVLFRKGDALQMLQETTILGLDKTGTLTEGRPALTDLSVAAVEVTSEHPIAAAIVQAAKARRIDLPPISDFLSITGYGVSANVEGKIILIGADCLMVREGIALGSLANDGDALGKKGKTPLYAAIDGKAAAVIAVADPIKASTPAAIMALHDLGLKVAMIAGDNRGNAQAIANELGIDHVVAEVLPEGKVATLEALRTDGKKLTFVGDGINDAPALAVDDVGIAIGTGTDIAINAADVVLMSGDLRGVVNAVAVSQRTMSNIRQNLFWACWIQHAADSGRRRRVVSDQRRAAFASAGCRCHGAVQRVRPDKCVAPELGETCIAGIRRVFSRIGRCFENGGGRMRMENR